MNTKINKILGGGLVCCAVGAAVMSFSSCSDFLEIKPQSEIILEDFWNEKADVENIVAGCYSALMEDGVRRRMMIWGECRSDNVMAGENINNDVDLYNILKENFTAMDKYTTWDGFYDVINRCNTVLLYAPGVADIDPGYTTGDLKATIAEVTALRALCYFYLIRTFRNVPYSSEAFTDDNQVMDLPATPFETVLGYLIDDLERVKDDAVVRYPETKPRYQTGRITRDAIYALLCELYLWKQDYDNCIKYAELVIQSKKDQEEEARNKGGRGLSFNSNQALIEERLNGYPLVNENITGSRFGDAYEQIFIDGASKETIFELSYEDDPSSSSMTNNSAMSSRYGNSNSRLGLLAATSLITEDIAASSARKVFQDNNKMLDARLYENCLQDNGAITKFATRSVTIDGTRISSSTFSPQAASYSYFPQNSNGSKWIIYRLPDIMLLEAEALCQKMKDGGDEDAIAANGPLLDKAFTLVNAINKRALCKNLLQKQDTLERADYSTKSLMEALVKRERRNELMFEGKYWYDLVRYCLRAGNTDEIIAASQNREDVNKQYVQSFFKKMDAIFWPYNNEEMKVNTNLVPNPAFGSGESTSYEKTK